jgi:hypothetical protein
MVRMGTLTLTKEAKYLSNPVSTSTCVVVQHISVMISQVLNQFVEIQVLDTTPAAHKARTW